jgi:hypothetical protein
MHSPRCSRNSQNSRPVRRVPAGFASLVAFLSRTVEALNSTLRANKNTVLGATARTRAFRRQA